MPHRRTLGIFEALALFCVVMLGACGFRAYSPPAGWSPAESVTPLKQNKNSIAGALHTGGGLFGPSVVGGSVSLRHGLTESYEIQGNVSYVHITEESRTRAFKGIISGRVGLKGLFDRDFKHLSWNASIGGGGHAAGGFISPEVGFQIGYENPFLTPWFRSSVFLSQPLGPRHVDIAHEGDDQADFDRAQATFGARFGTGLSIGWADELPIRLHLVTEMVYLARVDGSDDVIMGLGLGVETLF